MLSYSIVLFPGFHFTPKFVPLYERAREEGEEVEAVVNKKGVRDLEKYGKKEGGREKKGRRIFPWRERGMKRLRDMLKEDGIWRGEGKRSGDGGMHYLREWMNMMMEEGRKKGKDDGGNKGDNMKERRVRLVK